MKPILLLALALPLALAPLGACRSAYYATMETFGVHKRDLLVDEVEAGRADQAEAQEQFVSTFELFQELAGNQGDSLKKVSDELADELEDCEEAAAAVTGRIEEIERVAADLFAEWKEELGAISSDSLRRQSEEMLADTKVRYGDLIGAMKRAEGKMEPVLVAFRDHVLFLKHNLNARAVASLQEVVLEIEGDVDALIEDMEASIREADEFLRAMAS
jgi:hypothetical protein